MKKLFLSLSVVLCLVHGQSIAQQPGTALWTRLTNPSPREDTIHSIKVQSDSKIVAAGNSYQGLYMAIAIGRYEEGILDSSFGNNGIVTTLLDSAHTAANAVEIQLDGKIVVAGGYKKGTVGDYILARYKPGGSPDSSFGVNGIVRTDISGSFDVATALAIQTDGKIVAAGRSNSSLSLCRYNIDGSLDSSFDSDGKVTVPTDGATCMMLQANGKIVVGCGNSAIRLQPDGNMDSSFGTNAIATLTSYCYGMAFQNNGKILVAGGSNQFVLERLDTAGVHDNSFGTAGVVTTAGFSTPDRGQRATSVCVQADGRIIAAGYIKHGILGDYRSFGIARYHANGVLDGSFGQNGKKDWSIPDAYIAMSYSVAINNSNKLVVAGVNHDINNLNEAEWTLASCYLGPMLAVGTGPDVDGQIIVAPNPAEDFARIQSTRVENGNWHLSLCDLFGKTLYSETVAVTNNTFDKSISLIGLPAAMYLVKLDNGTSRMTVKLTKSTYMK